MIRPTHFKSYLPLIKSFLITCGVETIIFDLLNKIILFSGGVLPVKSTIFSLSISTNFSQEARCCETKGLVGAKIITFASDLCFLKQLAICKIPIIVFPKPVGKTTKEFLFLH